MDSSLWEASETDPDEYRSLSGKEQQYLLTGETATYQDSDLVEQISTKTQKLPDRFQQLIDDISLLYYHGYLDDNQDELWDELLGISNRSQVVRESPVVRTAHQSSGPELDFGFEIGSIVRFLHDESVPTEFVWGVIIGLVGESDRNWEQEAENLVNLFGELEDHYEGRLVSAGQVAHEDDSFKEERDIIRDILHEEGFATAPPLVGAVLREYTRQDTPENFEHTEKPSSTDPDPAEHPEPPSEMPSPEEVRRHSLETIVAQLANQTRLRSVDRLAKDLREDVFHIQNRELWGVEFDSIVRFLGENGKTHVNGFDNIEAHRKSRTRVLNLLSNKDSTEVNRPVTREDEEAKWTLTPYGELLFQTHVEYNCSTNWIYNIIANPERLDDDTTSIISSLIERRS